MKINNKTILVCDCEGTMKIDGKALEKACDGGKLTINRYLCRSQIGEYEKAVGAGEPMVVACTQEAPLFLETLGEREDAPEIKFTNIRERAGWSKEGAKATPKMAALLAESALDIEPTTTVSMTSEGALLIIGPGDVALEAASQVAGRLSVTVILTDAAETRPPAMTEFPVFRGTVKDASGHLGNFTVTVTGQSLPAPSSRSSMSFDVDGKTATHSCDLILDLRRGTPLFNAPEKRDGYFNPDAKNPVLVQKALLELTDMVGEFEKPKYVAYNSAVCAHSRNNVVGCSRCLDLCPTGAITPAGDGVAIDPYVCAGCGSCAAACPTGAAAFQMPAGIALLQRAGILLGTYLKAGGKDPALLVHDTGFGEDLIHMMGRAGGGLPANVLPFTVLQPTQIGIDFLLAAAAYGAGHIVLLVFPEKRDETAGLVANVELANAILSGQGYGEGRIVIVEEADPDQLEQNLYNLESRPQLKAGSFLAMGSTGGGATRGVMSLALQHLHDHAPKPVDILDLPAGAPFGAVQVRIEGCTLCLACVGVCPTVALKDNPEKPQLRFSEAACIQCGLCKVTCPEKVITLTPRLNFVDDIHPHRVIKEEEPFECIRCGKPFGARSTIETMVGKLADHPMFAGKGGTDLIKMCEDCRVIAQMEEPNQPLAHKERPLPRTTDDYLREREELRKQAKEDAAGRGEE